MTVGQGLASLKASLYNNFLLFYYQAAKGQTKNGPAGVLQLHL
jgi:hypothetical protein